MASLAVTASTSAVVAGLGGSSIQGQKLTVASPRLVAMRSRSKVGVASAKYDGKKSIYFDLGDISNTTGNWDLYGSDAPSPYNGFQSKFFETFGGIFTKRGLLLKFLILGGAGALGYASSTASGNFLPIKKGPTGPPQLGPREKV